MPTKSSASQVIFPPLTDVLACVLTLLLGLEAVVVAQATTVREHDALVEELAVGPVDEVGPTRTPGDRQMAHCDPK